jgi:hypothetical protein
MEQIQYTFWNGAPTNISQDLIAPVAKNLQMYLTKFITTGDPNGGGLPYFPMQGNNASMQSINVNITTVSLCFLISL